jgi:hypothetical protein
VKEWVLDASGLRTLVMRCLGASVFFNCFFFFQRCPQKAEEGFGEGEACVWGYGGYGTGFDVC